MLRLLVVLTLALLTPIAWAESGQAAGSRHTSRLGFTVVLPDAWVSLAPSSLTDLDDLEKDSRFSGLDPSLFASALQKVQSGEFEFFFRRPFEGFAQSIAVRERSLNIPPDGEALSSECKALPSALRQSYGREISPPACELRSVAGRPASYIEIEGPVPETVNMQYQVQRSKGRVLAITGTVLSAELPVIRHEFESIVRSMHITSLEP